MNYNQGFTAFLDATTNFNKKALLKLHIKDAYISFILNRLRYPFCVVVDFAKNPILDYFSELVFYAIVFSFFICFALLFFLH